MGCVDCLALGRLTLSVDQLANRGRRYWCHQFFLIVFGDGLVPKVSVGKLGMELGVWFLVKKTDSSTVGGTPSLEMVCVGTGKVLRRY